MKQNKLAGDQIFAPHLDCCDSETEITRGDEFKSSKNEEELCLVSLIRACSGQSPLLSVAQWLLMRMLEEQEATQRD